MLGKILLVQLVVVCVVIFILKTLFEKDLFQQALESVMNAPRMDELTEVKILLAHKLSPHADARLRSAIKSKCHLAKIEVFMTPALRGGLVVQMGEQIFDCSIMNRMDRLLGRKK